ncbi:MAG TPA: thioredoxin family protein [Euryarchaeota archaeon]|mgnify:CR=1 FL=1|nr:thioredoxin family protein [Euryarchaeota archaeon]
MKIEIFGTGCAKCIGLEKNVRKLVSQMNIDAEIVKIDDLDVMLDRGVMSTPCMAIDGEMVIRGRLPSDDELKRMLSGGK